MKGLMKIHSGSSGIAAKKEFPFGGTPHFLAPLFDAASEQNVSWCVILNLITACKFY
jgi:hypothetical protein